MRNESNVVGLSGCTIINYKLKGDKMFNLKTKKALGFFALFALILTSLTDASFAGSHEKSKKKEFC